MPLQLSDPATDPSVAKNPCTVPSMMSSVPVSPDVPPMSIDGVISLMLVTTDSASEPLNVTLSDRTSRRPIE